MEGRVLRAEQYLHRVQPIPGKARYEHFQALESLADSCEIIATRYNDVRARTNVVDKVLKNYTAAWEKHGGFLQGNKFVHSWYMVKQQRIVPGNIGTTAW